MLSQHRSERNKRARQELNEAALRTLWNPDDLGHYEGQWIAFQQGVLESSESLPRLIEQLSSRDEAGDPIFAFVTFRLRA